MFITTIEVHAVINEQSLTIAEPPTIFIFFHGVNHTPLHFAAHITIYFYPVYILAYELRSSNDMLEQSNL